MIFRLFNFVYSKIYPANNPTFYRDSFKILSQLELYRSNLKEILREKISIKYDRSNGFNPYFYQGDGNEVRAVPASLEFSSSALASRTAAVTCAARAAEIPSTTVNKPVIA